MPVRNRDVKKSYRNGARTGNDVPAVDREREETRQRVDGVPTPVHLLSQLPLPLQRAHFCARDSMTIRDACDLSKRVDTK